MKIILTLSLIGLILMGCVSQQIVFKDDIFKVNEFNSEFIGTWELVKRLDDNGKKIDTVGYRQSYEIGERPLTCFNADGTYAIKNTSEHKHNGKWKYDLESKSLVLYMLLNQNSQFANEIISRGFVKKHNDGKFYFEERIYKIIQVSNDTLKYDDLSYKDRNMIYRKIR